MPVERPWCAGVVGMGRAAAVVAILATGGMLSCSSGPGAFGLEIDPAEISLPSASLDADGNVVFEEATVDVLIDCRGNSEFLLVLALEGVPAEVEVDLPPGSLGSAICGDIQPQPAPMELVVGQAAPGAYELTLTGTNYDRSDIFLAEPQFDATATLTLTVLPAQ